MSEHPSEMDTLAMWLHTAAEETGQLESIRRLIRRAHTIAVEMYGAPTDSDECDADVVVRTLALFAGAWDEHAAVQGARLEKESPTLALSGPSSGALKDRDVWGYYLNRQASRINELLNIDQFRSAAEIYDILVRESPTTTEGRVRSHIAAVKKRHPKLLMENREERPFKYRLLKP